jgi:hypothetical protein
MEMKRTSWLTVSLSFCLLTSAVGTAQATGTIRSNWKTRYTTACATLRTAADQCLLCHTSSSNPDIDNLNGYGQALSDNSRNFATVEPMDSDGDGRTNLQEISQDCTLPGDLTSPTETFAWGALKSVYR